MEAHAWLEAVWKERWFGIALTGMCTGACVYLQWQIPGPGVSVAVMGVVAALMTARTKAGGPEKVVWMLIITALLVSEVLAIRKDRKEHDDQLSQLLNEEVNARAEANTRFSSIGDGINAQSRQSQQQFERTIRQQSAQFDATMTRFGVSLNTETGGDSVCYLAFMQPTGNAAITVTNLGKEFSLRSVRAHVVDETKATQLFKAMPRNATDEALKSYLYQLQEVQQGFDLEIGDVPVHGKDIKVGAYFPPAIINGNTQDFEVEFSGLNGNWHERFRMRNIPHKSSKMWVSAYEVRGPYTKNAENKEIGPYKDRVIEYADPPYPKVNGKIDWSH